MQTKGQIETMVNFAKLQNCSSHISEISQNIKSAYNTLLEYADPESHSFTEWKGRAENAYVEYITETLKDIDAFSARTEVMAKALREIVEMYIETENMNVENNKKLNDDQNVFMGG